MKSPLYLSLLAGQSILLDRRELIFLLPYKWQMVKVLQKVPYIK